MVIIHLLYEIHPLHFAVFYFIGGLRSRSLDDRLLVKWEKVIGGGVRTSTHNYCMKPPGRKNWPRPMMLGPQTSRHPKFPGWSLYYLPVTDNKYLWFIIMTLFHFTGFTVPILGVCKMLKTMNQ
ncbi:Dapdiamide synthesis protein DdaC [Dirofilaria immitis]